MALLLYIIILWSQSMEKLQHGGVSCDAAPHETTTVCPLKKRHRHIISRTRPYASTTGQDRHPSTFKRVLTSLQISLVPFHSLSCLFSPILKRLLDKLVTKLKAGMLAANVS